MTSVLFTNARIVDGTAPSRGEPVIVLVEGGTIREVARVDRRRQTAGASISRAAR